MYRLLGLEPSDSAMAFRVISQALHPDDDLKGELDRHLREGVSAFDQSFRLRHADGHWVEFQAARPHHAKRRQSRALSHRHRRDL